MSNTCNILGIAGSLGNAAERFDVQGNLRDETSKKLIRQLLQNLVD